MPPRRTTTAVALALGIALVFAGCSDDDSSGDKTATALPPSETPMATATMAPEPTPSPTARPAIQCLNEALPPPMPGEPSDAWLRARARLPVDVQVLRPERLPDGFGPPVPLEACVRGLFGDDEPRYTIVLDGQAGSLETIAFGLGLGFGEWGNFPGPPTTSDQTTVRGVSASLIATEGVSASEPALTSMMASWTEDGHQYWVRFVSRGQMTKEELVALAQSLTSVP